jgi:hypothetical protein
MQGARLSLSRPQPLFICSGWWRSQCEVVRCQPRSIPTCLDCRTVCLPWHVAPCTRPPCPIAASIGLGWVVRRLQVIISPILDLIYAARVITNQYLTKLLLEDELPAVEVVSVYVYNTHTNMSQYFEGTRTDIRCRLNKRVSRALYVQEWIRFGLAKYSNSV